MTNAAASKRQPLLVRRVGQLIRAAHLLDSGDRILVAVSGGPDSVALLSVLHALARPGRLWLCAVHVHHGLRGAEADEDQAFVTSLCDRLEVPLHVCRLTLTDRPRGRSLQEVARERRYAALQRLAETLQAHKIAMGHTADDQLETVIMWWLRGAGIRGLAGMPLRREPGIVRPLLETTRAEILSYLAEVQLGFRRDSSNEMLAYRRNRIRREVVPGLQALAPHLSRTVGRHRAILEEEDRCLQDWAEQQLQHVARPRPGGVEISCPALLALPLAVQRRVLKRLLEQVGKTPRGVGFAAVTAVLDRVRHGRGGTGLTVGRVRATRLEEVLRLEERPSGAPASAGPPTAGAVEVAARIPGTVRWPGSPQQLVLKWGTAGSPGSDRYVAYLDADRFTLELCWRSWRGGDRFCPLGMGGQHKKLQDFFVDLKLARALRDRVPLLVAPEGILWVAGYRIDHRFRVTSTTRRVLVAQLVGSDTEVG